MLVVTCPGAVKEIMPPHMQLHMLVLFKAGMLPIITVAEPGDHGATVTGTHGIGVNTPNAAAVAAATVGLAIDMHMPKGGIFTIGLLSMIFAAGILPAIAWLAGSTLNVLGATPNVHIIMAVETTCCGIKGIPIVWPSFYQRSRRQSRIFFWQSGTPRV